MKLSEATFPPVTIKIHWPDRWCTYCYAETETLPLDLYQCVSCGRVTVGKTEYVEGKVIDARPDRPAAPKPAASNYSTAWWPTSRHSS